MIDERTEQLINRRLDGELTDAESLELDRLLIRSPEARHLMEQYHRMDSHAGQALRSLLGTPSVEVPIDPRAIDEMTLPGTGFRRNLATVLAVAAMIALVVAGLPSRWSPPNERAGQLADQPAPPAEPLDHLAYVTAPAPPVSGTRNQRQHITRNIIGVMDDEGEGIYFLEVQRKDTTVTPVSFNY
jgi:anti-sigma factor RsiW